MKNITDPINPNDLVTKSYLDMRLNELYLNIDSKMNKKFDILEKRLDQADKKANNIIDLIDQKLDLRLEPFEEMRKDYYIFKDQVLKSLDWLVAAFKKFDEEHTILTTKYSRINEKLHNHETRLLAMEKK